MTRAENRSVYCGAVGGAINALRESGDDRRHRRRRHRCRDDDPDRRRQGHRDESVANGKHDDRRSGAFCVCLAGPGRIHYCAEKSGYAAISYAGVAVSPTLQRTLTLEHAVALRTIANVTSRSSASLGSPGRPPTSIR